MKLSARTSISITRDVTTWTTYSSSISRWATCYLPFTPTLSLQTPYKYNTVYVFQDTRRTRADRSQGEGLATASPDDDEDNADESEGQRDYNENHALIRYTLALQLIINCFRLRTLIHNSLWTQGFLQGVALRWWRIRIQLKKHKGERKRIWTHSD